MNDVRYRKSDIKYLKAMATHPDPVVTSSEIAEEVDVTQQAVNKALNRLMERDLARKKKVGARAVVWWPTTQGLDVYGASLDE